MIGKIIRKGRNDGIAKIRSGIGIPDYKDQLSLFPLLVAVIILDLKADLLLNTASNIPDFKIDLKSMQEKQYRSLGGVLKHVLDSIQMAHDMGLWVEVVTLVIPDFNDSTDELMDAARFIATVSNDIPWHVTAFHRDYKMMDAENTPAETLIRAAEIGQEAGLHYVYAGNLPGRIDPYEHTLCPHCGARLIERLGYIILDYQIRDDGRCPKCETEIAGVWPESVTDVRLSSRSDRFSRGPRRV